MRFAMIGEVASAFSINNSSRTVAPLLMTKVLKLLPETSYGKGSRATAEAEVKNFRPNWMISGWNNLDSIGFIRCEKKRGLFT